MHYYYPPLSLSRSYIFSTPFPCSQVVLCEGGKLELKGIYYIILACCLLPRRWYGTLLMI
jgi:hypothetical protein